MTNNKVGFKSAGFIVPGRHGGNDMHVFTCQPDGSILEVWSVDGNPEQFLFTWLPESFEAMGVVIKHLRQNAIVTATCDSLNTLRILL